MEETADAALLQEARRGDESSFVSLYHRHRIPLFRFAWRLTGSIPAAEDVVQDCWAAVLQRNRYRESAGSLRSYLFGVVRNLAYQRFRLNDRESPDPDHAAAADTEAAPTPFDHLLSAERAEAVDRAIASLVPLQREALVLFEFEDLSLDEIARITGADTTAVKSRLHRAREALRRRPARQEGLRALEPLKGKIAADVPTIAAVREFPPLGLGDEVHVDIMFNPTTGEKLWDVLRIAPEAQVPVPTFAKVFTGSQFSWEEFKIYVDGKVVADRTGTWMIGKAIMLRVPARGEYYLALQPPTGFPFQPIGWVDR